MSLKHIARYKAIQNGSTIEEELIRLKKIKSLDYKDMFQTEDNKHNKKILKMEVKINE